MGNQPTRERPPQSPNQRNGQPIRTQTNQQRSPTPKQNEPKRETEVRLENSPEFVKSTHSSTDELQPDQFDEFFNAIRIEDYSGQSSELTDLIPLEIEEKDIELGEFIGEGVYSTVFKGSVHGTPVAIKKFKNQGWDPETLKEVRKEVRIMKSIRHPNLLLFLGACTKPGYLMIVTELMVKSFHDLTGVDLLTRLRMAKEAAKGISWLHSLNPVIIHRDLKPENILVDQANFSVKVADFGLSLVKDHSQNSIEEMKKIRGSPAFMSPEALMGKDLSPATDVYSFSVILWELYTGCAPYENHAIDSFEQLIEEICDKGTRETIPDNCPPSLRRIISAGWQADPGSRPNFLQIIHQLDVCILEVAIDDKEARKLWKLNFSANRSVRTEVPWTNFLTVIIDAMGRNRQPTDKIFEGLKEIVCSPNKEQVSIESFGNLLKWFGPLNQDEKRQNFLENMTVLFAQKWFHGDISQSEAQTRLAGTEEGTFLIRLSSNPGYFALSKCIQNEKQEAVVVHIRISQKDSIFSYEIDGKYEEYKSLVDLVTSPDLRLKNACPGSKYFSMFRLKHKNMGYINAIK